jgi:hypothetical protein
MPLNKDARIEKISQLGDSKIVGKHKMEWDGINDYKDVYRVPISYLVYNKYNGRILSRTKSLETQGQKLNTDIEKDFKIIEKLLFDSHPSRNRKTEASIRKKGQERPGIITKDGVVIDGNRRFMSLNRIADNPKTQDPEQFKYFEAVILPVNLADNPDAIRRLETTYQMGEDEKLRYNPIEKYLKAQELKKSRVSENDIAEWMGETKKEIIKYLKTMQTMDDYLDSLEYYGIYTQLDGREDWFLELTTWMESFKGEKSKKAFDGYKDSDVDDLILIFYDYIRAKHGGDGKRFRKIARGNQPNHIFGNKDLWKKFKDLHFENIEPVQNKETSIDYHAKDLKSHLDDRDEKFKKSSGEYLKENLNDRISELSNKQNQDKPEKLINKAKDALKEVSVKAESFSKPDVQRQLKEVSSRVTELLSQNSASLVLEQSLDLINKIDIDALNNEDSDKRLDLVTQINRLTFEMKKELGG